MLRDAQLERFATELANALNEGLSGRKAATKAGESAGYSQGSSFAANCHKRALRKDVKARVAELRKPGVERAERSVEITTEFILNKCHHLASPDLGKRKIKVSDQLAALHLAAKIKGFMAPQKHDHLVRTPADELTDDELARIAAGDGETSIGADSSEEVAAAPVGP